MRLISRTIITICFALPGILCAAVSEPSEPLPLRTLRPTDAFILGLVEGATEFLPVSSTGHLIVTKAALGLDTGQATVDADEAATEPIVPEAVSLDQTLDAYLIIIQIGAIAAVLWLYWPQVWLILLGALGRSAQGWRLGMRLAVAMCPAVVLALVFESLIDRYLFSPYPVALALALGAFVMLGAERWRKHGARTALSCEASPSLYTLSVKQAFIIGLCQSVAIWPGMSRSMTALVGGYIVGLRPREAAEFSFLLGLPILTGAALYEGVKSGPEIIAAFDWSVVCIGIGTAALAAAFTVKLMLHLLRQWGLGPFAFYRLGLALLLLCAGLWGLF